MLNRCIDMSFRYNPNPWHNLMDFSSFSLNFTVRNFSSSTAQLYENNYKQLKASNVHAGLLVVSYGKITCASRGWNIFYSWNFFSAWARMKKLIGVLNFFARIYFCIIKTQQIIFTKLSLALVSIYRNVLLIIRTLKCTMICELQGANLNLWLQSCMHNKFIQI